MKKLEIQGDVALRVATLPKAAKKIEHRPLALGETSGHAHCVEPLNRQASEMTHAFDLFEFEGKTFVAVGGDGATLRHIRLKTGEQADHNALILAPNTVYEVILQNEYNPEAGAFRRVLD